MASTSWVSACHFSRFTPCPPPWRWPASAPPSLGSWRLGGNAPDILGILADGAVGGKIADARGITDGHGGPAPLVEPELVHPRLGGGIGVEIARHHEPVMLVKPADQVAVAVGIVRREHARGDGVHRLLEPGRALDHPARCLALGALLLHFPR